MGVATGLFTPAFSLPHVSDDVVLKYSRSPNDFVLATGFLSAAIAWDGNMRRTGFRLASVVVYNSPFGAESKKALIAD
jgi:hypothetical protein